MHIHMYLYTFIYIYIYTYILYTYTMCTRYPLGLQMGLASEDYILSCIFGIFGPYVWRVYTYICTYVYICIRIYIYI